MLQVTTVNTWCTQDLTYCKWGVWYCLNRVDKLSRDAGDDVRTKCIYQMQTAPIQL